MHHPGAAKRDLVNEQLLVFLLNQRVGVPERLDKIRAQGLLTIIMSLAGDRECKSKN